MAVVPPAGDHIISRTSAWVQQHHSRSRVSASSLVSGVDAQQGDIQLDNGGPGPMSIGSVSNSTQPEIKLGSHLPEVYLILMDTSVFRCQRKE